MPCTCAPTQQWCHQQELPQFYLSGKWSVNLQAWRTIFIKSMLTVSIVPQWNKPPWEMVGSSFGGFLMESDNCAVSVNLDSVLAFLHVKPAW